MVLPHALQPACEDEGKTSSDSAYYKEGCLVQRRRFLAQGCWMEKEPDSDLTPALPAQAGDRAAAPELAVSKALALSECVPLNPKGEEWSCTVTWIR